jgi:hypothetical protein
VEPENDVVFPQDIQDRMRYILVADIDARLKDLSTLVALQETELTLLWFTIIGLTTYIVLKESHGR